MGFSSKKITIFCSKTKKFAAKFCNCGIQTVCPRTFPSSNWVSFDFNVAYSSCWGYSLINILKLKKNLASNQGTEAHTEEKRSRRICRYDGGLEFGASLETHVHAAAREAVHWACGRFKKSWACGLSRTPTLWLQGVCTFLLPLALRRAHAATPMY